MYQKSKEKYYLSNEKAYGMGTQQSYPCVRGNSIEISRVICILEDYRIHFQHKRLVYLSEEWIRCLVLVLSKLATELWTNKVCMLMQHNIGNMGKPPDCHKKASRHAFGIFICNFGSYFWLWPPCETAWDGIAKYELLHFERKDLECTIPPGMTKILSFIQYPQIWHMDS